MILITNPYIFDGWYEQRDLLIDNTKRIKGRLGTIDNFNKAVIFRLPTLH
jgi:hypothetical protein